LGGRKNVRRLGCGKKIRRKKKEKMINEAIEKELQELRWALSRFPWIEESMTEIAEDETGQVLADDEKAAHIILRNYFA
jgi:hypothetical protein